MSAAGGGDAYRVARLGDTAYVRVEGLANLRNAPMLDAFLDTERENGLKVALIDLGRCNGMDSTFMGTLIAHHHHLGDVGGRLVVVQSTPQNRKLLDMLGVSTVLPVLDGQVPPELDFVVLEPGAAPSPLQRAELMKTAHEHLVRLSDSNRAKFQPFLVQLDRELARLKPAEPPPQPDAQA